MKNREGKKMPRIRVMIVDDAIYMRVVLKDILERHNYEVVASANNGQKAVEIYKDLYVSQRAPDLVLMDITMRKMDGVEALKYIKKIDKRANVVMCTSVKSKDKLVSAMNEGATYYINKPFEDEEVIETIEKALEKNRN